MHVILPQPLLLIRDSQSFVHPRQIGGAPNTSREPCQDHNVFQSEIFDDVSNQCSQPRQVLQLHNFFFKRICLQLSIP
jgi:hypothetical protein